MRGKNKVFIAGHVGHVELRYAKSGTAILTLSVANNRLNGDKEVETVWHKVVCFGKLAERIDNIVQKGSYIDVEGEIRYGSYENKDGVEVPTTQIVAYYIDVITNWKQRDDDDSEDGDDVDDLF